MPLTVQTQNTKVTLSDRVADACLRTAIDAAIDRTGAVPDVWGGQEWGPQRNDVLADHGRMYVAGRNKRDKPPAPLKNVEGLVFVRHVDGGPPIGFSNRFHVQSVETVVLAKGRKVRPQPGTRAILGDNDATLVVAYDRKAHEFRRFLNFHLDAHVQDGAHYRYRDPRDPRAVMHREERRAIAALGVDVALGDTNWHDLRIPGLVSVWHGRTPLPTLGRRAIDTIYRDGVHAAWVRTYGTPAREHKLVMAGYPG